MSRTLILPCSIGDTVYVLIDGLDIPKVQETEVIAFELWNKNKQETIYIRTPYGLYENNVTVFMAKVLAEGNLNDKQ